VARAITAPELLKLRENGQKSSLNLLFPKPTSVYTARVNQATFTDSLYQVTYDGGSGTLADVKAGMTMYIGSAAGLYDKGIARIRKTPSATIFYIGESSDITFEDDDYLTIVNEFRLWPKHPVVNDQYVLMDYDDAYGDEHDKPNPVPVIGPSAAVKLVGATVVHQRDGSGSWSLSTDISSHAWTAGGPAIVTIDSMGSATPTFTFSTAGYHLIEDTVTDANSKTKTGYRVTYVYDSTNAVDDFQLKECFGDFEEGGWSFTVRMFDDADITNVVDRAMVMLVADETYASTAGSIGPLSNYENLICVGHIDGESITRDPSNASEVEFTVRGPHFWLQEIPGFPVGIENTEDTATAWTNYEDLTVDAGLWHLLEWRSTATAVMDIPSLTGDTKNLPTAEAPGSQSLWDQLNKIAWETILARPLCDRYGRLYIEPETQIVPSGDRSGFPTVQTITDNDWGGQINIERRPKRKTSLVDMSGISYDGSAATPLISKAMGVVYALYGKPVTVDNLLLASQAQLNTLSGNYFAWENNEYPHVDLNLAQNNRFFDITPRQYAVLNLTSSQTPREITWTSKKFIPRRVELDYETGVMKTSIELEAETIGTAAGQTVPYIPPPQYGLLPTEFKLPNIRLPALGPLPNINFPDPIPTDPVVPPGDGTCPTSAPANGPYSLFMSGTTLYSGSNYRRTGQIDCAIRTAAHDNVTTYEFTARWQKYVGGVWVDTSDDAFYTVKAYEADGTLVATGAHDAVTGNGYTRTGVLNASAVTVIKNVVLELDYDIFRPAGMTISAFIGLGPSITVPPSSVTQGAYGVGYRADIRNVTYGSFGGDYNLVATTAESAGNFLIEQYAFTICSGAAISIFAGGRGGTSNPDFTAYWSYPQSPAVSSIYSENRESFSLTSAVPHIRYTCRINAGVTTNLNMTVVWYKAGTYRVILSDAVLYNVCGYDYTA